jgi:hypothetical protein
MVFDGDGLAIPEFWQGARRKWDRLALPVRKRFSGAYVLELLSRKPKKAKQQGAPATRFTTDYAVKWGRRQKHARVSAKTWQLIDREHYDYRTKRHHDLELGVDAIFDDGGDYRIGIQGAGKGERSVHYQRFMDRGGPEKAARRRLKVLYLEFERGNHEPILKEEWA